MTPGWTTATRFARSISRIVSIARERDCQRALDPGRAPGQAGARAARHDRDAELGGDPDQLRDLGGGRREDDGSRQTRLR